jgi:hypothetical protein
VLEKLNRQHISNESMKALRMRYKTPKDTQLPPGDICPDLF